MKNKNAIKALVLGCALAQFAYATPQTESHFQRLNKSHALFSANLSSVSRAFHKQTQGYDVFLSYKSSSNPSLSVLAYYNAKDNTLPTISPIPGITKSDGSIDAAIVQLSVIGNTLYVAATKDDYKLGNSGEYTLSQATIDDQGNISSWTSPDTMGKDGLPSRLTASIGYGSVLWYGRIANLDNEGTSIPTIIFVTEKSATDHQAVLNIYQKSSATAPWKQVKTIETQANYSVSLTGTPTLANTPIHLAQTANGTMLIFEVYKNVDLAQGKLPAIMDIGFDTNGTPISKNVYLLNQPANQELSGMAYDPENKKLYATTKNGIYSASIDSAFTQSNSVDWTCDYDNTENHTELYNATPTLNASNLVTGFNAISKPTGSSDDYQIVHCISGTPCTPDTFSIPDGIIPTFYNTQGDTYLDGNNVTVAKYIK